MLVAYADQRMIGSHESQSSPVAMLAPEELEEHRGPLIGYSYRMLGSVTEAEDAVQETMLRAWRAWDGFEGRASRRTWLYRIATNVCLDMLKARQRRARPMEIGPAWYIDGPLGDPGTGERWIEPIPDSMLAGRGDPADVAVTRETIRLAFIAALQHLPPRQRAILILREVLGWSAAEVAGLLDTTVVSVNSALQRARTTLSEADLADSDPHMPMDPAQQDLLDRYLEAFEHYDLDSFVSLLHEDVTQSMPPYEMWLEGPDRVRAWMIGPGIGCRGSLLFPTVANGLPAFGQYRPDPDGGYHPWALHVLEVSGGVVVGLNYFLDTETLFPRFGMPARLDESGGAG
jgi:RNA polymerase sigma-70 factor (ECF subfamily)